MKADPEPTQTTGKSRPNFTREFKHAGRRFLLYKRSCDKDASYYCKFEHNKTLWKKSLKTNKADAAEDRAKLWIDSVLNSDWETLERLNPKQSNITLDKVFAVYDKISVIDARSKHNNQLALMQMIRTVHGVEEPDKATLRLIDASLARRFQEEMVKDYIQGLDGDKEREARDRSLRSSRSLIQQARCLFSRKKEMPEKYQAHGIILPSNIESFMSCRLEGKLIKTEYYQPSDETVKAAFTEIEKVKDRDPVIYLAFWFACGAGLRRKEIQHVRWEHLIERDGMTWVSGGIGKNGAKIEVPIQTKAVEAILDFRKTEGPVLDQRGLEWAKRLNWWMSLQGWGTEKKMHELRAYIGSLLYRVNPHLAKAFMRHESIKMTEDFYCRYGPALKPVDVL